MGPLILGIEKQNAPVHIHGFYRCPIDAQRKGFNIPHFFAFCHVSEIYTLRFLAFKYHPFFPLIFRYVENSQNCFFIHFRHAVYRIAGVPIPHKLPNRSPIFYVVDMYALLLFAQ